ncbi:MAG: hypothetical protein HWE27_01600 [Gammaproteobacteria bacterium]|nr:hypothetical protein [Gammaproteobacteria bacterium]
MAVTILISVYGDDRPGIVKSLAEVIRQQQGNWLESRLSHLGGKFAGLILVSVDDVNYESICQNLNLLSEMTLDIRAELVDTKPQVERVSFSMEIVANDRAGIVHDITSVLGNHSVNVESLDSECDVAAMAGSTLFKSNIEGSIESLDKLEQLQRELERITADLMIDCTIVKDN